MNATRLSPETPRVIPVVVALASLVMVLAVSTQGGQSPKLSSNPSTRVKLLSSYGGLPLSFEVNEGQTDPRVDFLARGKGYTLFLTPNQAVLALRKHDSSCVLRMNLVGVDPAPEARGVNLLDDRVNYFRGNDPGRWCTNVAQYGAVEYRNVYRGIDLVYHGSQRRLEYDFVVTPGANPRAIRLAFAGAQSVSLDDNGELILKANGGQIAFNKPQLYQEIDGTKHGIEGQYVLLAEHEVGFRVGAYDASKPLVIDPVLAYSTYLGGSDDDQSLAVAVDSAGRAYVTGQTFSPDFPGSGALSGINDAFVTRFTPSGAGTIYSTYLGGDGEDIGTGIAVDGSFNAYIVGSTTSTNFPTASPEQPTLAGDVDAFVTKLNPGGALVFSTYLGGSSNDIAFGVAVDTSNNVYVAGQTVSTNFPTTVGAFQPACGTDGLCNFDPSTTNFFFDAFVTKLSAAGTNLIYSTYLGGEDNDMANAIAVDTAGNAYVGGQTFSAGYPVTSDSFQTGCGVDGICDLSLYGFVVPDAFVTKLDTAGSSEVYSTFLGGDGEDSVRSIVVDSDGDAFVAGSTTVANFVDFPTVTANDNFTFSHGGFDIIIAEVDPEGTNLLFSCIIGGTGDDIAYGIGVNSSSNAFIAGRTDSTNFPLQNPLQPGLAGGSDAFVSKMTPDGSFFVYSTYLGGTNDDAAFGIAVDSSGDAYVAGSTSSADFPTASAFQSALAGGSDAYVAKLTSEETDLAISIDASPNPASVGGPVTFTITVTNSGPLDAGNVVITDPIPTITTLTATNSSQGTITVTNQMVRFNLGTIDSGDTATATLDLNPTTATVDSSTTPLQLCNFVSVQASQDDPDPTNNSANACVDVPAHDLATIRLRAPKSVTLSSSHTNKTVTVTLKIQNRSPTSEVISNMATLDNLITLVVETLGTNCPSITPVLKPPKKSFPIVITSKRFLTATYLVTFDCANDPEATTKSDDHNDFDYTVSLHHEVLDGLLDSHTEDDVCPRPPLATVKDPYPNGKIRDKGCDTVFTDIVVK